MSERLLYSKMIEECHIIFHYTLLYSQWLQTMAYEIYRLKTLSKSSTYPKKKYRF